MTLLTWPTSEAGLAWYDTPDYRPYRDQRHGASKATVVGVPAFSPPRSRRGMADCAHATKPVVEFD